MITLEAAATEDKKPLNLLEQITSIPDKDEIPRYKSEFKRFIPFYDVRYYLRI